MPLVRLSMTSTTRLTVSIYFVAIPHAVRVQCGMLEAHLHEIEIECLPRDIPQGVSFDVTELMAGASIYVRDLQVGDDVTIVTPGDHLVAAIVAAKAEEVTEDEAPLAAPPAP